MKTPPVSPTLPPWSVRPAVWPGVAAGLLLLLGGCSRPAAPPDANRPPGATTEQRWVIGTVARDLADLAAFAANAGHWTPLPPAAVDVQDAPGAAPGQAYTVALRLPGGEPLRNHLRIAGSVWSPELYAPTIRALCARLKLSPAAGDAAADGRADADLLRALTRPLTADLAAQNERLSAELQAHPLDARVHERAALLLGTLGLRENSGQFWDARGACNRAAAHLAFARALRPDASACGEVAELLVGLLLDSKADCQRRIALLRARIATQPELAPWANAAALRNTRDYRLLGNPAAATLLERLEWFRAMMESVHPEQTILRSASARPEDTPDWGNILLQGDYGVDAGHQFALPAFTRELADAARVFPEMWRARTPGQFAAVLNAPAGGAVQAGADGRPRCRVIDQGAWAGFFQRHLLHAADETYDFLQNKWGVTDQARDFHARMGAALRELTLYPLCLDGLGIPDGESLHAPAADLLVRHPERVGDHAWEWVVAKVPARHAPGGSWAAVGRAWFSPSVPVGTAYGFQSRVSAHRGFLPAPGLDELKALHALAPWQYSVCETYADVLAAPGRPTFEQFQEATEPLLPYFLPALVASSKLVEDDPARYAAVMSQVCAQDPDYLVQLGRYYVGHGMEVPAAQAYQAAIDRHADAVTVYSSCGWLVNYYYGHGQAARALAIAKDAAEVYSADGLATLAGLLERMDRVKEAEGWYQKIEARYQDAAPLQAFRARQAGRHPEYAAQAQAAERRLFPQGGMQTVAQAPPAGKPTAGILVQGENALSHLCGLKPGAIVVGLDGKRVGNMEQYTYVRALTSLPEMDLLVYQDGRYQTIHASLPDRMFNLDFITWP